MICGRCNGQGVYLGCMYCDWNDEDCDFCDGTGHVECPLIDKEWHQDSSIKMGID